MAHAGELAVFDGARAPAAQAADVELAVLWIEAGTHDAAVEGERELPDGALPWLGGFVDEDAHERAVAVAGVQKLAAERAPIFRRPHLPAGARVHLGAEPDDWLLGQFEDAVVGL